MTLCEKIMAPHKIFITKTFEDKLEKCGKEFSVGIDKIFDQLAENPCVGKPLGAKWFREKKHGKYRIYYL